MQEEYMYLYHGTSSIKLENILKNGLTSPYLTDEYELAIYYAKEEVDVSGGNPIVLKINISTNHLLIDRNALDEPVSWGEYTTTQLEDKVDKTFLELSKTHPEWRNKNNHLVIPDNQYMVSLKTVNSCKSYSIIFSKDIEEIEPI